MKQAKTDKKLRLKKNFGVIQVWRQLATSQCLSPSAV